MANLNYLYVEDDRLSREVMEMMLRDMLGVTSYVIWESSEDFLHRLESLSPQPDIILLDIHMAPITGFEMLEMIRNKPKFQDCRVYALTASVMNEEVNLLRTAGFDGVIGKPLDVDTFPELLEKLEARQSVWKIT
ncbi:MAG: response regulator [Anaerolineae bacterium]|nr:response regulator [Anaerolineae bacterium]